MPKPNYLEHTFSVMGYSAQSLDLKTVSPEKIAKHLRSELDRLQVVSEIGRLFMDYELPKSLFVNWRYETIGSEQ
jgi:hypothetical protein